MPSPPVEPTSGRFSSGGIGCHFPQSVIAKECGAAARSRIGFSGISLATPSRDLTRQQRAAPRRDLAATGALTGNRLFWCATSNALDFGCSVPAGQPFSLGDLLVLAAGLFGRPVLAASRSARQLAAPRSRP